MAKLNLIKGQTVIYKTLHRKLTIAQHELYKEQVLWVVENMKYLFN
jgi:hypothetical protein